MKTICRIIASSLLLSAYICAQVDLDKARAKADHASPAECSKACFEAAHQVIEASDKAYTDGNIELGKKLMTDALNYAKRGTEASVKTHKNQKNNEIALRRMAKRVHDIGDSLSVDDRPPVVEVQKALERLGDDMLTAMFGTPKKSLGDDK